MTHIRQGICRKYRPADLSEKKKVIEYSVNGRPVIDISVCMTYSRLVEIAFGREVAANPRARVSPGDYYGRIIGGGKLRPHESVHLENDMRFTITLNDRQ